MNYWMEEFIKEQERECFEEYKKLNLPIVSNCCNSVIGVSSNGKRYCDECGKEIKQ